MPRFKKSTRSHRVGSVLGPRPACPREDHMMAHHGDVRCDPYHWLRDRRRPEVRKLLDWHNAHTRAVMDECGGTALSEEIFSDMRARIKGDDASLPYRDRGYWYYTRHVPNADYPLYCRRPATDATNGFVEEVSALWSRDPCAPMPCYDDEMVFLDPNLLMRELRLGSIEIGDMDVSPDEKRVAVAVDCSNGREVFTIFVLDMIDVNYARWLRGQSGLHRAWMEAVTKSNQSIYTASPSSCLSRNSPMRVPGSGSGSRRGLVSSAFPSVPPSAAPRTPTTPKRIERPSSSGTVTAASTAAVAHRIVRRIDVFDAGSEVIWLSDTTLLYVGTDEKMRSCRIVHHDLTRPVDSDAADIVCYEELDEALWVGSLGFTADGQFATFSSGSTDSTSTFVVQCDEGRSHYVSRTPIVLQHFEAEQKCISETGDVEEEEEEETHETADVQNEVKGSFLNGNDDRNESAGKIANGGGHHPCALNDSASLSEVKCFAARVEGVEYELDHHKSLLGDDVGAWIVTTNDSHRVNFGIDFIPDAEWHTGCFTRRPLFAYDARIKIDGIECARNHLLVSVRRAGAATVLLLPTHCVRDRWSADPLRWTPFSLRGDTVDMCVIAARCPSSAGEGAAPLCCTWAELFSESISLWASADAVDTRRETASCHAHDPHEQEKGPYNNAKKKEVRETAEEENLSADWQLRGVSCYAADSSFDTVAWRLVATHLIIPAVTMSCTFDEKESKEDHTKHQQDPDKRQVTVTVKWLRDEAVGGAPYRASDYRATVVWVPSDYAFRTGTHTPIPRIDQTTTTGAAGGTHSVDPPVRVPVYICWRGSGSRPPPDCGLLLTVYGSYGECCDVDFDAERLALLDRGCVWAAAAVRGGGELGVPWRDAGRRLLRARAVNDFLSVAAFLQGDGCVQEGPLQTYLNSMGSRFCAPGRLVAAGSSAGGFIVAAAMNAAPSLLRAVVATVPFVDCLTTLLDDGLPLTVSDWEEYGNPRDDPAAYWALRAVSPMDNVRTLDEGGPAVLLQTAWHDTRVGYWESLAFAARLTDAGQKVLHYCDFGAGHGGATGRYERLRDVAQEYAFALTVIQRPEI